MRLVLGGKEFDLKPLTLNDWIEAEDLGLDMRKLQRQETRLRDFLILAFVAVKKVDPTVTMQWVGEVISLDNMEVLAEVANFINLKGTSAPEATSSTMTD